MRVVGIGETRRDNDSACVEINLASITDEQAGLEMIAEEGKADAIIARAEQVTAAVRDQIRA